MSFLIFICIHSNFLEIFFKYFLTKLSKMHLIFTNFQIKKNIFKIKNSINLSIIFINRKYILGSYVFIHREYKFIAIINYSLNLNITYILDKIFLLLLSFDDII